MIINAVLHLLFLQNYVKAKRLFVGEPVWTPYNRPADDKAARHTYVESIAGLKED